MANLVLEKEGAKHSLPLKPINNDRISNYYLQFEKDGKTYIRELFEEAPEYQKILQFEKNSKKIFLTKTTPNKSSAIWWGMNQNIHISNGLIATFSSDMGSEGLGEVFNLLDYYNWNEVNSYGSIIGTKTDSFYYMSRRRPSKGLYGYDTNCNFTVTLKDKGAIKVFNCILNLPGGLPGEGYYMVQRNDEYHHFPPSNYHTPYEDRNSFSSDGGYFDRPINYDIDLSSFKSNHNYGIEEFFVVFKDGRRLLYIHTDPDDYKFHLKNIYNGSSFGAEYNNNLNDAYVSADSVRNNAYGGERLPGYGFNVELFINQSCDIKFTYCSRSYTPDRTSAPDVYMNNDLKELVSNYGKINIYNNCSSRFQIHQTEQVIKIYDRNSW